MKHIKTTWYHLDAPADNRPDTPFRIAFVTDVHDCKGGPDADTILASVRQASPDVILCGGDLITARHGDHYTERGMKLLEQLCREAPVYLGEGNHESRMRERPDLYRNLYETCVREAEEYGACWMVNESKNVCWKGMRVQLSVWAPPLRYYDRFHPNVPGLQEIEKALGKPEEDRFHLLLSHHPDHFPTGAAWGADLVLSGHFHGGIIRVPFLGGVFGGSLIPFPKYDAGLFEQDGHRLIVGTGLGLHTIPVRIFNPFELTMIEII